MSKFFSPDGSLNVAIDAADLPETGDAKNSRSGAMVRCKNLRTNESGKAKTRDGSAKINTTAIDTAIWLIEEQGGSRFTFAGTQIYENESSIATGLTSAQWSAIKYNAYNDTTDNIFALNGTDRKRIQSSVAYEWGLAAPTTAPTLGSGSKSGLTGQYNAKYTYVRKVGSAIVSESNPSDAATTAAVLENQSLTVNVTQPTDSQVTHIRLYRTLAGGATYFLDSEIAVGVNNAFGYSESFEADDAYIAGTGIKFTTEDTTNGTENTYSWEELYKDRTDEDTGGTGGASDFYPSDLPDNEQIP